MAKTPKYIVDECRTLRNVSRYVRCWKERGEIVVQIWAGVTPDGEPAGDWAMPGILGIGAAIEQSDLQTTYPEIKAPAPKSRKRIIPPQGGSGTSPPRSKRGK